MRLLDRHISRELIGPFLFGVAAFTSLMFAGSELFKITELVAEYHAPLSVAIRLVLLYLPTIVVVTLPMAMLLAALLGFGRLSGDSEVIALFANGVSLYRIALPVAVMAVLVTVSSFVLNEIIAPQTLRAHDRIIADLRPDRAALSDKPLLVIDSEGKTTNALIYVPPGGFDPSNDTLHDVVVIRYRNNVPALFVYGREATWSQANAQTSKSDWVFKDGYYKTLGPTENIVMPFHDSKVKINKTPNQFELSQRKPEQMSFAELRDYIQVLQEQGQDVNEYRVKLYHKISMPLASLVFALIGAPLGLRPQRSSSAMGLGLSIVIIFAYWVITHYLSILGDKGSISPAAANFIPTLLGTAAGIWLIVRAAK